MKNLTTVFILFFAIALRGQSEEFIVHTNGLIYNEETMTKLSEIVDSLNLKFKSCDFDKVFYSKQQTIGHFVSLEVGAVRSAKSDMEQGILLENFLKKYPNAEIDSNILILRTKYNNYKNKEVVRFEHVDLEDGDGDKIDLEDPSFYERDVKDTWILEYREKSKYSKERIIGFYFPRDFQSYSLPSNYSSMIGYADCMIDTTTTKFNANMKEGWVDLPKNFTNLSNKRKVDLLDQMRSTRVIGGCSQDMRPRIHAVNIALLSADTYNWEVFLKAHFDIMNDRFERVSDGNYAWGQRNTYIKELEELNIDVSDLIWGITLRIENPSKNHYYGSIGRLGRSLSETKNSIQIEEEILKAVSDPELDHYNRVLFYYLFLNYNHYIKNELRKDVNSKKLELALSTLPDLFRHMMNAR